MGKITINVSLNWKESKMTEKIICPACGQHSFDEDNDFEECPVCGWVNDGVQRADPDYRGGYNRISLNEAKKKFAEGKKVFD